MIACPLKPFGKKHPYLRHGYFFCTHILRWYEAALPKRLYGFYASLNGVSSEKLHQKDALPLQTNVDVDAIY